MISLAFIMTDLSQIEAICISNVQNVSKKMMEKVSFKLDVMWDNMAANGAD